MSEKIELNIVETMVGGEAKNYGTFLPHSVVLEHGLIGEVIVGEFKSNQSGEVDIENGFLANSLFKETIFSFVKKQMANDSGLINAAKKQKGGWVYIIDQRTPDPQGEVPPQDIIGAFEVVDANLGEFSPNKNYSIRSNNGFVDFGKVQNINFNHFLKTLVINNP